MERSMRQAANTEHDGRRGTSPNPCLAPKIRCPDVAASVEGNGSMLRTYADQGHEPKATGEDSTKESPPGD